MKLLFLIILVIFFSGTFCKKVSPLGNCPLYKQCDPKWGSHNMNGSTICREGCAMSSVSMALNCFGIKIPTSSGMLTDSNPDTLNTWLQEHQGYVCLGGDCNNLVLNAPDRIPTPPHVVKYAEPYKLISKEEMRQHIDRKGIVIAHVRNSGHFVLLTGYETESDIFYCNDPFFSVTYYTYQEMSSQLLYYMA